MISNVPLFRWYGGEADSDEKNNRLRYDTFQLSLGTRVDFKPCSESVHAPMSQDSWLFSFALVGALGAAATVIDVLIRWLKLPKLEGADSSQPRSINLSISKKQAVFFILLLFLSIALSSIGFYESIGKSEASVPRIVQWGVGNKHCTVVADTSPIMNLADKYSIVLACGVVDPTVDLVEDKRILLSGPFNIYGNAQAMSAGSNPEFDTYMESFKPGSPVSMWQKVFIVLKGTDLSKVHELSDVPRLGGKLF